MIYITVFLWILQCII